MKYLLLTCSTYILQANIFLDTRKSKDFLKANNVIQHIKWDKYILFKQAENIKKEQWK